MPTDTPASNNPTSPHNDKPRPSSRIPKRPSGWPYEALCRYAISTEYKATAECIHTGKLPGASRTSQRVRHQVDLFWTTENALCKFLIFANAKLHRQRKADLRDIMTLLAVMQEIGAQKGMLITNTGFTSGVLQIAQDHGIALLLIKPLINLDDLPTGTVAETCQELESRATHQGTPVYNLEIVRKSWVPSHPTTTPPTPPSPPPQPPEDTPNPPDLSYFIAPPNHNFLNSINNKSMTRTHTPNKIIQNTPAPTPPTNRPFRLRTK